MNKQLIILLIGRILTNFADSLYMIATIWYVKTVTGSPLLVGVTEAAAMLPILVQFLYGPLIDRLNKKVILYMAEFFQAVMLIIISLFYFNQQLTFPLLLGLMLLAFMVSEITYPVENTLIDVFADREKLTRINSIFAFCYQTLDLICNGISGILIALAGIGTIYLSNSVILIASGLLFLLFLKIPQKASADKADLKTRSFFQEYKLDLMEGLAAVKNSGTLLTIMMGIAVINLMATMGLSMLPFVSPEPSSYGFWLTAMAVGTLLGSIIAGKLDRFPLNQVMPTLSFLAGGSWVVAISCSNVLFISYLFFGIAWMGIGVLSVYVQTLIQVNLPEKFLGRGFAFLSSFLGAISPLGYLLGGILGEVTTAATVLMAASSGYFIFGIYFIFHPKLRQLNNRLSTPIKL